MSWAQSDLRDFANAKNEDGTWKYPEVRGDLKIIKDKHAEEMFVVEQKAAFIEGERDSLGVELMISNLSNERTWIDNLEFGIIVGAAITILINFTLQRVN